MREGEAVFGQVHALEAISKVGASEMMDGERHLIRFIGLSYEPENDLVIFIFDSFVLGMPLEAFQDFVFQANLYHMRLGAVLAQKELEETEAQRQTVKAIEMFLRRQQKNGRNSSD